MISIYLYPTISLCYWIVLHSRGLRHTALEDSLVLLRPALFFLWLVGLVGCSWPCLTQTYKAALLICFFNSVCTVVTLPPLYTNTRSLGSLSLSSAALVGVSHFLEPLFAPTVSTCVRWSKLQGIQGGLLLPVMSASPNKTRDTAATTYKVSFHFFVDPEVTCQPLSDRKFRYCINPGLLPLCYALSS